MSDLLDSLSNDLRTKWSSNNNYGLENSLGTSSSNVLSSLDVLREDEMRASNLANQRRMGEAPKSTFGSELIWGFTESALVAPGLWESLGKQAGFNIKKGDIGKKFDQKPWEDMSSSGKAGYIIGAGAGMFIPFSFAGKVASKIIGIGGKIANKATPFLTRAATQELQQRAGKLAGKSVTELTTENAEKIIKSAQKVVANPSILAKVRGLQAYDEITKGIAHVEMRENIAKVATNISDDAIDDISKLALDTVRHHRPENAHAVLEGMSKMFGDYGLTSDIVAALSYDALLGATYGFGRHMAQEYADLAWDRGGQLGASEYYKHADFYKGMHHAMEEGFWLSFLGPVRLIAGGTGSPLISVPRFWNKNPGKVNKIVGGIAKNWRKIDKIPPKEARASMQLIDAVSNGSVRHFIKKDTSPLVHKALEKGGNQWWEFFRGDRAGDATKALNEIRKAFVSNAPKILARETFPDLVSSLPRMGMGALAMNAPAIYERWQETSGLPTSERLKWTAGTSFGEEWSDIGANVLVAMLMTRSGRAIRRFDRPATGSAVDTKFQFELSRGEMKQFYNSQDSYYKEVQAGLEAIGLHPNERYKLAQQYTSHDGIKGKYDENLNQAVTQVDGTLKDITEKIDSRTMSKKEASEYSWKDEPWIKEGKHLTLEEAYQVAASKEKLSKEEQIRWQEEMSIAKNVENYMQEELMMGDILRKPMTPQEAREYVSSLANIKVNGKKLTTKNTLKLLREKGNEARLKVIGSSYSQIVMAYKEVLENFGIDNIKYDSDTGILHVPENFSLPRVNAPSGTEQHLVNMRSAMYESMEFLNKMGKSLGWIRGHSSKATYEGVTGEGIEAAVLAFQNRVLALHQITHGNDWNIRTLQDGGKWNDFIMNSETWHYAYGSAKSFEQRRNIKNWLQSDYKMESHLDQERIRNHHLEAQMTLGFRDVELKIDSEGSKAKSKEELNELAEWVKNANRIFKLGSPSDQISNEKKLLEVKDASEIKQKMEELFGNAFNNKNTMRLLEAEILNEGIERIGIEGVDRRFQAAIVSLLQNPHYVSGNINSLRSLDEILGFLDTMSKTGAKSKDEVDMLKDFYRQTYEAAKNSKTGIIRFNEKPIPIDGNEQALYDSIREAEFRSRESNVLNIIHDSAELKMDVNRVMDKLNQELAVILDTDTDLPQSDKIALRDTLTRTQRLGGELLNQMTIAKRDGNIIALNRLSQRKVELQEALENLTSNIKDRNAHETYQKVLAEEALRQNEINMKPISKSEIDRIINDRIGYRRVKSNEDVLEEPNSISLNQFEAKYFVKLQDYVLMERALNEPLQTSDYAIQFIDNAKAQIMANSEALGRVDRQSVQDTMDILNGASSFLKQQKSASKPMDEQSIVSTIRKPVMEYIKSQLQASFALGTLSKEQYRKRLGDLDNDINQILTNAFSTRILRTMQYHEGGFNITRDTVPNTDRTGFLAVQKMLGLEGKMFILKSSGVTSDGQRFNRITADIRSEINNMLDKGEVETVNRDAEKQFYDTQDPQTVLQDSDLLTKRKYKLIALDEGIDLIVEASNETMASINNAFKKWDTKVLDNNSEVMITLDRILKDGMTRNNEALLEEFRSPQVKEEALENAIFLTRAISDSKSIVEQYLKGGLNSGLLKSEWKRLKMFEHRSGFTGTKENVKFVHELLKETVRESNSESHKKALKNLETIFGKKLEGTLDIFNMNDELSSNEGLDKYNPFSHRADAFYRLVEQNRIPNGDASNLDMSWNEFLRIQGSLAEGKSRVDAVTYLTKNHFEALMTFLGVKDSMIEYKKDGSIRIRAGAIKPMITHSKIEADGSFLEYILKTSFQYNPKIEPLLKQAKVGGIAFQSGAKKFKTRQGKGDMQDAFFEPQRVGINDMGKNLHDIIGQHMPKDRASIEDNIAKIPLESINLKQASREHTGLFAANTAVHFSNYGMEGARKWSNIGERIRNFERDALAMWADPIARTALARSVYGYSTKTGDPLMLNTGLDFIIDRGGVLVQDWVMPVLERALISQHLQGGNISARKIHESETAVMTPDGGGLDMPVRTRESTQLGFTNRYMQRKFGGGRVSSFLANKTFKFSGEGNVNNSNEFDAPATIVRLSNGLEGVLYHGLSNKFKADKSSTLFIDGFMVENGKVYDMNESITNPITNKDRIDYYLGQHKEAMILGDRLKEKINHKDNGDMRLFDVFSAAGEITRNLGDNSGIWVATMNVRQPRNQAGDVILEKMQGITKGRGNVKETNTLDAIQVADADFDLDKITTYFAAPKEMWAETARLAGHTVYNTDVDIQGFIQSKFAPYGDSMGHKDNIQQTALVRSRFVKMHQTMTYLKNMLGNEVFATVQVGEKGAGAATLGIKLKSRTSGALNTEAVLSEMVKAYIDVYDKTPMISDTFVRDAQRKVLFDKDTGLFDVVVIDKTGETKSDKAIWSEGVNDLLGSIHPQLLGVVEAMERRLISPINKYLQYNRGETQLEGGNKKSSSIQDFSDAYSTTLYSLNPKTKWAGLDARTETVDISMGLQRAIDYFKNSSNPFDIGMRQMHNLHNKKHKEINLFESDLGKLIQQIEEGYIDTGSYDAQHKDFVNNAWSRWTKNQWNMAELATLVRKQWAVEQEISALETRFSKGDITETPEYKALSQKKIKLTELVEDMRNVIGASIDYDKVMNNEFFDHHILKKSKGEGEWRNNTNTTVVVRGPDGKMSEVILKGKTNRNKISLKHKVLKHGRKYEFMGEDNIGAQINNIAFGMYPVYIHPNGNKDVMHPHEYRPYIEFVEKVEMALRNADRSVYQNKRGRDLLYLTQEQNSALTSRRKADLHKIVQDMGFNEHTPIMKKWAIVHALLQPKSHPTDIIGYPMSSSRGGKKFAFSNKVYMHDWGRTEKLLWDWLNEVRDTSHGNYKDSGISPKEAEAFMDQIVQMQKQAFYIYERPYGDIRLKFDGFWTAPGNVKDHHHFRQTELHPGVYERTQSANDAVKMAANTLIRYSTGEGGLIDPITLYKAQQELISDGIPASETFMMVKKKESNVSFGNAKLDGFKQHIDFNRKTGTEGVLREKPVDVMEEAIRCLK